MKRNKIIIFLMILPLITLIHGLYTKEYITVFNSLLTGFCIIGFTLFNKKTSMFNNATFYSAIIFIMLSVFIGRTLKIYNTVVHWDKFLHLISGFVIASAAQQIYEKLNGDTTNKILSNWFIFLFSASAASVWEFYEFTADIIFNISAQNGLTDTMLDMIAGTISALIYIIIKALVINLHKNKSTGG